MSPVHSRRERLLASVYAGFGEAAVWRRASGGPPVSLTVRRASSEELLNMGDTRVIADATVLYVRRSEIADPAEDDQVSVTLPSGALESFRVLAEPRLKPFGMEWLCEATPIG